TDARLLTSDVERALASAPRNAIFPGYIRSEQLREAYCGADAFCFLTKEETEGIVLLEALACGAPALVRAIPLYREQLPDGVLTHQVGGDGPEFAGEEVRRLTDLLEGRLPDLTGAGRSAAEALDLRVIAAQLAEIYQLAGVRPHRTAPRRSGTRRAAPRHHGPAGAALATLATRQRADLPLGVGAAHTPLRRGHGIQRVLDLLQLLREGADLVLQLEDAFDAGEIDALLLGQAL